jgi:hypothetical protein
MVNTQVILSATCKTYLIQFDEQRQCITRKFTLSIDHLPKHIRHLNKVRLWTVKAYVWFQ